MRALRILGLGLLVAPFCVQAVEPIQLNISFKSTTSTPEEAVGEKINTIRDQLIAAPALSTEAQQLRDVLIDISGEGDIGRYSDALRAISPRANTAQTTQVTRGPTSFAIASIGRRLAALRRSASKSGGSSFAQQIQDTKLPILSFDGDSSSGFGGRLSSFVTSDLSYSAQEDTPTEVGFDGDSKRLNLGADYRFTNQLFGGMAASLMSSQVSLTDQGGSLRAQEQVLTAYGTHYGTNPWYVETVVSFGRRAFELERQVSFIASGNPVNATASSDPQGSYVNAVLGSGYDYAFRNGFSVGLNATLAYSSSTIEAFEETSAGGLNLALEEQKIESMVFSLGTQMQKPVGTRYGVFLPQFSVHWNHEFQQEGTPIRARFVNDPFGTQFSFTTEERDQDYLLIAAGASLVVPGGLTAFFNLDTQLLIDNFEQSSVALGVRKEY